MTGHPATASDDAAAQRAAEQARLRKERREAKIKAGGSARLSKITGAGDRFTGDSAPSASVSAPEPAPTKPSPPNPFSAQDPDEVDISESYYVVPQPRERRPPAPDFSPSSSASDAQLRQMLLRPGPQQGSQQGVQQGVQQGIQQEGPSADDEDPLMKMMSQMMGGTIPGGPSSPFPNFPMPQQQAAVQPPTGSVSVWRILHALFAIGLGIFFALTTPFSGSKMERERAASAFNNASTQSTEDVAQDQRRKIFFWTFATAEVVLLSSRFLFDKASTRSSGFVGTVLSYLPQPYRGYLEVGQRYMHIFTAVRTDLLTCIFVLGICTWLAGGEHY